MATNFEAKGNEGSGEVVANAAESRLGDLDEKGTADEQKLSSTLSTVRDILKPGAIAYDLKGGEFTLWNEVNKGTQSAKNYISADPDHPAALVDLCKILKSEDTKLLPLSVFAKVIENAGNNAEVALKGIRDLLKAGVPENKVAQLMTDKNFPWKNISELISDSIVKKYLLIHDFNLAEQVSQLGAKRFGELCASFKNALYFKVEKPESISFYTAVVYYGLEFSSLSADEVAKNASDKVIGIIFSANASKGAITDEEAVSIASRSPGMNLDKAGLLMTKVRDFLPDFYASVESGVNTGIGLLTLSPLAENDDIDSVIQSIKNLLSAGFTPVEVCVFAKKRRDAREGNSSLPNSFVILADDVLKYKELHHEANSNEINLSIHNAVVGDDALRNHAYEKLGADFDRPETLGKYLNALEKYQPFAKFMQNNNGYAEKFYDMTQDPQVIIQLFEKMRGAGIDMGVQTFKDLIQLSGTVYSFSGLVHDVSGISVNGKQRTDLLIELSLRKTDSFRIFDALKLSGLSPDKWAEYMKAHQESYDVFVSNLPKQSGTKVASN